MSREEGWQMALARSLFLARALVHRRVVIHTVGLCTDGINKGTARGKGQNFMFGEFRNHILADVAF